MPTTIKHTLSRGVVLDAASLGPQDLNLEPLLSTLPNWQVFDATTPDAVMARVAGNELIITNKVVINADIIAANPQLKLICVAATGTNNVDLKAAKAQGITVCNVVNYGPNSVAQHALMLMLNLATNAQRYGASVRNGDWSRSPFFCLLDHPIIELAGKNLGIIGYGVLGQQLAQLGRALGMKPLISARPGQPVTPAGRVSFEQVLAQSDVLSLHCPLTPATEKMIDSQALAQMKSSAFLINCARGGLIDEPALATALRTGKLAGAGLDVLSQEPPPEDHPLLAADIPNLLLTPHTAWASREARQNLVDIMTNNIACFIAGTPQNCV
ncbi:2-hydroxyacid dehydrogenase [Simiduia litorea]|uniref:D-2-hydroxyacid dehydrogenase n=1 Tax=Simiduia litorea TaxID=1435348 RepID=UPI0036F20FBF